jgi:hypothetical protein
MTTEALLYEYMRLLTVSSCPTVVGSRNRKLI